MTAYLYTITYTTNKDQPVTGEFSLVSHPLQPISNIVVQAGDTIKVQYVESSHPRTPVAASFSAMQFIMQSVSHNFYNPVSGFEGKKFSIIDLNALNNTITIRNSMSSGNYGWDFAVYFTVNNKQYYLPDPEIRVQGKSP